MEIARIRSSVTISVVPEAKNGPFVFHDGWENGCRRAKEAGFDGVELFAPSSEAIRSLPVAGVLTDLGLSLAAVGTGGGWVRHQWHLCHPDPTVRARAVDFIKGIIDAGAEHGAPAILGSMQGRWGDGVSREQALDFLGSALVDLGRHAAQCGTVFLYEHLNRYETNLFNLTADAKAFIQKTGAENVRLLCDLFHMNIEEVDIAAAIEEAGDMVGHVHFVDSNRHAAGFGHTDFAPIGAALRKIGFHGFASAEAFPKPDAESAAQKTMESFKAFLTNG